MKLPVLVAASLCVCLLRAASFAAAPGQDSKPAGTERTLSAEERLRLVELPRAYAAARNDLDQKQKVVQEAVDLGPLAVKRLQPLLLKELNGAAAAYRKGFFDELKRVKPEELEKLEAAQLVEASKRLPDLRTRVARLGEMADLLTTVQAPSGEDAAAPQEPPFAERLERFESDTLTEARNAVAMSRLDPQEVTAILETNKQRVAHGLTPLLVDPKLCLTAADHSQDMEKHDFFSHTSPVPGKQSFTDRAQRFGANASAENIARTSDGGAAAVKMWMESEGHRANLLNPEQRRLGLGRSGSFYTQLFGR